jgi:hypothetical protein
MHAMQYLCSLPNTKKAGPFPELFSDDPGAIAAFVAKWDRPGWAVYRCVNPLRPGSRRRSIEDVEAIERFCIDLDFKDLVEVPEEIDAKLLQLPLEPTAVRNSGGGRHIDFELNEPIDAGDDDHFARAREVLKRLTAALSGDPAPAHPAALLREEGSHNSKREGEPVLVETLWGSGKPVDITDIEAMLDLLPEAGMFTRKPFGNGHDEHSPFGPRAEDQDPPIDVDQRLADMRFEGPGDSSIHQTQLQCTASLLRNGVALEEAVQIVLEATRSAVADDQRAARWSWKKEELGLRRMACDFVAKNPELVMLLPDYLREDFEAKLAEGRRALRDFQRPGRQVARPGHAWAQGRR